MPSEASSNWVNIQHDYVKELDAVKLPSSVAEIHPLLPSAVLAALAQPTAKTPFSPMKPSKLSVVPSSPVSAEKSASPKASNIFDPLRGTTDDDLDALPLPVPQVEDDPLRGVISTSAILSPTVFSASKTAQDDDIPTDFEFWADKCPKILATYTTSASIAVDNDFLSDEQEEALARASEKKNQTSSRLEELDKETGVSNDARLYVSQKEFIANIEDQHKKLKAAWAAGERVIALRIAIQCAKNLGDTSVPAFYPSMFVLLTRILDTFGELVFQRIKSVGVETISPTTKQVVASALPNTFKSSDVSGTAKEMCRNWMFKTACIRELLPRLYIDLALMKCYRFLEDDSFLDTIVRLSQAIRGIGNPLVAAYARSFLTSKALDISYTFIDNAPPANCRTKIAPMYRRPVVGAFEDMLFTFKSLTESCTSAGDFSSVAIVGAGKISSDDYVNLYTPALNWVTQNVSYHGSEKLFEAMLAQYNENFPNAIFLRQIMASFPASIVSKNALSLTTLIKNTAPNSNMSIAKLYLALGQAITKVAPPEKDRLPVLNLVWKVVSKTENIDEYTDVAQVFIEYLLQHFTSREVNVFLGDVIKHVRVEDYYKSNQEKIEAVAAKVLTYSKDISKTLTMDNFLPLVDLLEKDFKVRIGKLVIEAWGNAAITTSDPVLIHTLFDISKALHDSISALSYDEEKKQTAALLISFIRTVDFGKDLEQQLTTYVDFRASFASLDSVIEELVRNVERLVALAHSLTRGNHTKKTAAFVKAALAYCHITIPSLEDPYSKLSLYLSSSQVALMNNMVVQSEGFLKAALALLPTTPLQVPHHVSVNTMKSMDETLQSYLLSFLSFILYFPGHPKHGPFYLLHGVLNVIQELWPTGKPSPSKLAIYIGALRLCSAYTQTTFPFAIDGVVSNDKLYAMDDEYKEALSPFFDKLAELLLAELTIITQGDVLQKKASLPLIADGCIAILGCFKLNKVSVNTVLAMLKLAPREAGRQEPMLDKVFDMVVQKYKSSLNKDLVLLTSDDERESNPYFQLAGLLVQKHGFEHKKPVLDSLKASVIV